MATPRQTMYPAPMKSELFSILCEFKGGTYSSQVRAISAPQAMIAWADLLRQEHPIKMASDPIAHAATEAAGDLVPLAGLTGIWCWTTTVGGDLVIAHIVQSAQP
ncbi:MAG: hypothetical protein M0R03_04575 [Novosphingobium sp.]|nr:hypothetical protein [Novosphingobium sp.]